LGRKWIGVDDSEYAIKTIMKRLEEDRETVSDYEFLIQEKIADKYCHRIEINNRKEFLVRKDRAKYGHKKRSVSKNSNISGKKSKNYIRD